MKSLRSKILVTAVGLVLLCQLLTVAAVLIQAHNEAERQAYSRLEVANSVVGSYLEGRQEQLQIAVQVLADDFGFRSAVASGDADTVNSVLRNHASRIKADYAVIFDAQAEPIAANTEIKPTLSKLALVGAVSDGRNAPIFFEHNGTIYQSVIVAVLAPVRIGWVTMGFAVDSGLASMLSRLTDTDVSFHGRAPAVSGAPEVSDPDSTTGHVDARDFVSIHPLSAQGAPIYAQLHLGRPHAMQAFRAVATSLIVLALIGAALTGLGAVSLSRTLTRPLTHLLAAARRIGQGDYSAELQAFGNDEIGELAATVGTMQSEIGQRERAMRHQAEHDTLTQLPNRQALLTRTEALLAAGRSIQVFVVSVRGIHEVNSTLGLELGDSVVQTLARLFSEGTRHLGYAARIADTRFCLVAERPIASSGNAMAERIKELFEARPVPTSPPVSVKVSIGIASNLDHDTSANSLVRMAWMASLQAINESPQIACYDTVSDETILRRRTIVEELEAVTRRDELYVVFQPKYDNLSNRFTSVEALLRWQHPRLGLVPPDEFIPLAEGANSIGRVTRFVLEQTVTQLAEWNSRGYALRAAVNVSAKDIEDPTFAMFIVALLDRKGVGAEHLELEITETSIASNLDVMLNSLRVLRGLGIELAIDDFGTGFSSLSQLKKLPVQRLKIDKSFVLKLASSADDQHIVRSIIDLAHGMDLAVVAEGVEDAGSAELLRSWGCEELQGYLFSKPVRAEELEALLIDSDIGREKLKSRSHAATVTLPSVIAARS